MDRSQSLLNNNSHDLEAVADLHMEDVTAKSNSVPKRPIAINSFVVTTARERSSHYCYRVSFPKVSK